MPHTDTTVVARSRSQKIIRTILKLPIRILKAITTPTSLYVYILYVSYFFIFTEDLENFTYRDASSRAVTTVSNSNTHLGAEEVSLDSNRRFEFWINNFKLLYMYEKKIHERLFYTHIFVFIKKGFKLIRPCEVKYSSYSCVRIIVKNRQCGELVFQNQ